MHRRSQYRGTRCSPGGEENAENQTDFENLYFESYAKTSIHQQMIRDKVRTGTYRNAIIHNKHLFRGKVVLDVGCGTGILSLFAARAGARRVIGVEKSDFAVLARRVVLDNQLSHVVTIVRGKVEEVELPGDVGGVDVIVSEWMGYCLFYESMLDSVLFARDKWLVEGGVIFPDIVRLFICGIRDNGCVEERVHNLRSNMTEFDMSSLKSLLTENASVVSVSGHDVITTEALLKEFDLKTGKAEDVEFKEHFTLISNQKSTRRFAGFATFFDVTFSQCHRVVQFSTSPRCVPTHWSQTVFHLDKQFALVEGEQVAGTFVMARNKKYSRELDMEIALRHVPSYEGDPITDVVKKFSLKL